MSLASYLNTPTHSDRYNLLSPRTALGYLIIILSSVTTNQNTLHLMDDEHILTTLRNEDIEVTFKITSKDLLSFLEEVARKLQKEPSETYLSPKLVCEMLDINISTLWRWRKIDYLLPLKIGGKIRYKRSVIEKLLQKE